MKILYIYNKILKKIRGSAIKDSSIDSTSKIESGTAFINSSISKHSFIGYDCSFNNVEVGSFCSIANKVTVGGTAHPMHFVSTSPVFLSHKDSVKAKFADHVYLPQVRTCIGHDVWIGEGALIKAGVNIGTGAVIGMGSVVTKDVPPYSIVGGNPSKVIRMRFDEKVISELLKSKWWEGSEKYLKKHGKLFNDPEVFLQNIQGEVK